MSRRLILVLATAVLTMAAFPFSARAGEIDILIEKLVEKGILSHGEAQQILTETKEEVRKEIVKGTYENLPQWIQTFKLGGDLRLRYEYSDKRHDSSKGDNRGRVRFRLGATSKVNDQVEVGFGIATESDGGDHDSRNITFGQTFEGKSIRLDYAYAKYSPYNWLSLYGGKMKRKNILWQPMDIFWDGDITPEGGAVLLSKKIGDVTLFSNQGYLIAEDDGVGDALSIAYVQPGAKVKLSDNTQLKAAVTYYGVDSKNDTTDHGNNGNTMDGSAYKYDYDSINPCVELSVSNPFGGLVPYASLFGEFIHAFDPEEDNNGWGLGLMFGDKKIKKFGHWQFKYQYAKKEADCWFDPLNDSDAYSGDTNVKGHEWILKYGLGEHVTLGFDAYFYKPLSTLNGVTADRDQFVLQTDLVFKF